MKILLIEDNSASIANAQQQLVGHELKIATTAMEVLKLLKSLKPIDASSPTWQPDLIITDVNIPMGDAGIFGVSQHYTQTDQTPAGLIVAIQALILGIPCYVITDSNSHRDLIGLLLDRIVQNTFFSFDPASKQRRIDMQRMFHFNTRPEMLGDSGKSYEDVVRWIAE